MRVSVLSVACLWTLALHLPVPASAQNTGSAPRPLVTAAPVGPVPVPVSEAPAGAASPEPKQEPALGPAPTPETRPETSAASACAPGCRPGFMCLQGQCVSACNPLCAAGQTCSVRAEQAECVASAPMPSELRFFGGSPAAVPVPDPSAQRHDGLMLRVTLGVGGAAAKQTNADVEYSSEFVEDKKTRFSGAGSSFSVDVGGPVGENIMLHGRAAGFALDRPALQIDGADYGRMKRSFAGAFLLAPAVSYYFMPVNIYVTGAAGLSFMGMRYWDRAGAEQKRVTNAGIGLNLDVGKEWWATPQVGLGVAARFWYSRISDQRSIGRLEYEFAGGAVLFSATYQ